MKPTIYATHRYSVQNGRGDAVAHIEVDERGESYWVTNLWVDPDHRRTGVAAALMQRCIAAWAHVDLYLAVQPYTDAPQSAEALARWYARFGFALTDVPGVMYRPAYATNSQKEAATAEETDTAKPGTN
ncbi:GNAT family N-acetyltransferase [Candidatus Viridilinea mediisalina]|uniref:N-acetyltransferase domain-containing protein n=1 Tax=Candidatus Viridilinea mediisalina TaxID=2024553 RepID=A0A2A6RHC5_9CHLR|nr:GNAT family N-acetyltransferase [Candidatus Viridilinea mediisalina]PDW02285.1 hypothetical protein CJ255_14750 [Candidatus Viridilinea mediisalina]